MRGRKLDATWFPIATDSAILFITVIVADKRDTTPTMAINY